MKLRQSSHYFGIFILGSEQKCHWQEKEDGNCKPVQRTNSEKLNYLLNLPVTTCDLKVTSEKESRSGTANPASEAAFRFSRFLLSSL